METLHGEFATYLFKTFLAENNKTKPVLHDVSELHSNILRVLEEVVSHEDAVIDYTFSGNIAINDITGQQLKIFIRSRANSTLELLGYNPVYEIDADPIGEWFYKSSKAITLHDFFNGGTSQYRRSWKFDNFSRLLHITTGNVHKAEGDRHE